MERDEQSGLSVVKFMDSKGTVVTQVPPEQYLRMIQLIREFGGLSELDIAGQTAGVHITGLLVDKKA